MSLENKTASTSHKTNEIACRLCKNLKVVKRDQVEQTAPKCPNEAKLDQTGPNGAYFYEKKISCLLREGFKKKKLVEFST